MTTMTFAHAFIFYFSLVAAFVGGYVTCALLGSFADSMVMADVERDIEILLDRISRGQGTLDDARQLRELIQRLG